ncbi:hypothetical protein NQ317_004099 [Molorchus minor]|uniref:Endonuclease/exonuclease/phosphatase domain-containing protein n=1 Tax=Molorchus minor TaxID=1323400 RepID=A0ABQ9JXB9_9CUCU|nr:hypothetical protein NQ317_004099 [Molorchus minor]
MDNYLKEFKLDTVKNKSVEIISEGRDMLNKVKGEHLKIYHNNIRSLSKNLDETLIILEEFAFDFQLIVLTETWRLHNTDMFQIEGYNLIYNEGQINQSDGVVIYINKHMKYEYNIIKIDSHDVIEINTHFKGKTVQVVAVYRSPSLCPYSFNFGLFNYLKSCKKEHDISIIIGDINIDILEDIEYSQEYLNIMSEENYISMINTYTRVQKNSKSCLDHIFLKTKLPQNSFLSLVLETNVTDHYSTILQYTCNNLSPEQFSDNSNSFKKFINYTTLNNKLRIENWLDVYKEEDIEKATQMFVNKLKSNIEECTKKGENLAKNIKQTLPTKMKRTRIKNSIVITDVNEMEILTINVLKTFYVPFTSYRSNLPEFNTLEINQNTLISGKESIKYLGIVIDCHLRWDLHMQYLVKKLRSLIPKFKYFKKYM